MAKEKSTVEKSFWEEKHSGKQFSEELKPALESLAATIEDLKQCNPTTAARMFENADIALKLRLYAVIFQIKIVDEFLRHEVAFKLVSATRPEKNPDKSNRTVGEER